MNRISPVLDRLIGIEDPDQLMSAITQVVSDSVSSPQAGQFFLFSYQPSSSGRYDANPLVAVTDVYSWGFRGTNFHHGESRSYSFSNVSGSTYRVYPEEIKDLQALPFGKMRLNS
tara:strand:- start:802 stop:1146 length:345 start_codon:yes stop_codon:yes gene_type:complete